LKVAATAAWAEKPKAKAASELESFDMRIVSSVRWRGREAEELETSTEGSRWDQERVHPVRAVGYQREVTNEGTVVQSD